MGFDPGFNAGAISRALRPLWAPLQAVLLVGCGVACCLAWQAGLFANVAVGALLAVWVAAAKMPSAARPPVAAITPAHQPRADAHLRQLRATLDQVPAPLLAQSPSGVLHALNRAGRALFRTDDVIDAPAAALRAAITTAETGQRALVQLSQAGGRSHAVSVAASFGPDGARLLVVLTDVQAEIRAAEAAALRELLAVLGHEIMNALTPVTSLAESAHAVLTQGDPDGAAQARDALEIILRRAQGLDRFVQGYRQLARVPEPVLRPVPASMVLHEAASLFTARWSRLGVRLTVVAPSPDVIAPMDAALIGQALLNLLANAAEAAIAHTAEPQVWLAAAPEAQGLAFRVRDNGPGVDPAQAVAIFQPFTTAKPGGSGIGLALARQIAQTHGGRLTVSERAGEGAEFLLVI